MHRCEFAEAIIFADEDHRQFPDCGQIERFVKGSLIGRPVAKEAGGHVVTFCDYGRQGRPGRDRQSGADDAIGAKDAQGKVNDVHRAALAFAIAGALAINLRHHLGQLAAFGDQVAMAAMGRGDTVGLP